MNRTLLLQSEESRIEQLLKQNESIFSCVKEKVRDINQTSQKLESNLRNIRSPVNDSEADKENHHQLQYSFSGKPEDEVQFVLKSDAPLLDEMSFNREPILIEQESHRTSALGRPMCVTFIPFNKLYRSPILQLKSKDKVILARKYKGSSITANQDRITDGKIYRLPDILTDEEDMIDGLCSGQSEIICFAGAKSTLKRKLHMCLLLKEYQRLSQLIASSKVCKLEIHYSEIADKVLAVDELEKVDVDESNKHTSMLRLSNCFEELLSTIGNRRDKAASQPAKQPKHVTRISRIIFASDQTKHLIEIVSTNNLNPDFLTELRPRMIVWCINPLVKNYDDTQSTLESILQFERRVGPL